MKKYILSVFLLFFYTSSFASEIPSWLKNTIKSKKPNQLAYFLSVQKACPFSSEKAEGIIEGTLVRSRVKPLKRDIYANGRVYLSLAVSCTALKNRNPVFVIEAHFARYMPSPPVLYDYGFGTSGIGDKDFILQSLKGAVEDAITAHVKANFDL